MSRNDFIMANELSIRLGFFFGSMKALAAWVKSSDQVMVF